jgi:hypothetical protein
LLGYAPDSFVEPVRRQRGVAEDKPGCSRAVPVPGQRVHDDAVLPDGGGELNVVAVPILLGQGAK